MKTLKTGIPGLFRVELPEHNDDRGSFRKLFHEPSFEALGLSTRFPEEYISVSRKGALRGLHFQTPPHDHDKLVVCIGGRIFDAVVDLRVGSPAFKSAETFTLSPGEALFIPRGAAHGFFALEDNSSLLYKVGTVHAPENDCGVLWSSAGISWPLETPMVSERDKAHPRLEDYESPFVYET